MLKGALQRFAAWPNFFTTDIRTMAVVDSSLSSDDSDTGTRTASLLTNNSDSGTRTGDTNG